MTVVDESRAVVALHTAAGAVRWTSRTFLGWTLGFFLAIGLLVAAEALGLRETQFPLALGMGAGVGLLQARLISRAYGLRWSWVLASALGLAAPFLLSDMLRAFDVETYYSLAPFVALGGATVASLQWALLRRRAGGAGWWCVTASGWMLAGSTVWINETVLPKTPGLLGALRYVAVVLAGGAVLGVVGALALRRMRRR